MRGRRRPPPRACARRAAACRGSVRRGRAPGRRHPRRSARGAAAGASRPRPAQRRPSDAARRRGAGGPRSRGLREQGVLVRDDEPSYWWLSQDYVGPDGVARTRQGFVAALRAQPYDDRVILPHERTHAGPKEGRLRLLRATRTQLEPLFFLWDGTIEVDGLAEPDLRSGGDRLWRLDAE